MLPSAAELLQHRQATNARFIEHYKTLPRLSPVPRYLTASEEAALVYEACRTAHRMCNAFAPRPLPAQAAIAAVAFVRRFYLHSSVMDFVPARVVPVCVFLACKTEDVIVTLKAVAEVAVRFEQEASPAATGGSTSAEPATKTEEPPAPASAAAPAPAPAPAPAFDDKPSLVDQMASSIREFELELCRGLKFQFVVHGPLRPLRGFLVLLASDHKPTQVAEAGRRAEALLWHWWLGDAMLLYPPSQLALAALWRVASELQMDISDLLSSLRPTKPNEHTPALDAIARDADAGVPTVSPQYLQELNAVLLTCRNPFRDPSSAEMQAINKKQKSGKRKSGAAAHGGDGDGEAAAGKAIKVEE